MGEPEPFKPDEEEVQIRRVLSCPDAPVIDEVTPYYRKSQATLNSLGPQSACDWTE
jgi:hypothetical protein